MPSVHYIHFKYPFINNIPSQVLSLNNTGINYRVVFCPLLPAYWLVYKELSILNTFCPDITLSLPVTYQKLCPWLTLVGFIGHDYWADFSVGCTYDDHTVYISNHSNSFSCQICLPVMHFTANKFYQGTHKTLSNQYRWHVKYIVYKCIVYHERILLLSF